MATEKISTSIIADDAVTGDKIENNPTVAGNLSVAGTAAVTGTSTFTGASTFSGGITNAGTISAGTIGSSVVLPSGSYTDNMKFYQTTAVHEITSNASDNNLVNIDPFKGDENGSWIQPKYATSRIWFECSLNCGHEATWRGNRFLFYYKIGSGSFQNPHFYACSGISYVESYSGNCLTIRGGYLIPNLNTTEKVYIKMHHDGHDGGGHLHLNQNNQGNASGNNNTFSMPSWIMLREVAQ